MCTLSVIPASPGRGMRLVVNRDERRTRESAWPPRVEQHGDTRALYPIDPESAGTWIAATTRGLVFAVLNLNRQRLTSACRGRSRGEIIPALVPAVDLQDVEHRLGNLPLEQVAPFRLLATDGSRALLHTWEGQEGRVSMLLEDAPFVLSSSSLGDHLVEDVRAQLFAELLADTANPWTAQDKFHQHSWPDRRHLSVLMSRLDASTVSRTVVVANDSELVMSYAPVVNGWIGPVTRAALKRVSSGEALAA